MVCVSLQEVARKQGFIIPFAGLDAEYDAANQRKSEIEVPAICLTWVLYT